MSPFSYFAKPQSTFVGNQVQYIQEPKEAIAEPEQPAKPAKLVITPKTIPPVSGELYTPDFERPESQESDEEVVFIYEDNVKEPLEKSSTPNPVSYTPYDASGGSHQNDYLSYPSYPPLAPAPPKPKHYGYRLLTPSPSTPPIDLENEVDTPPNTHYKRDEVALAGGPELSYKSAYTSQDLQNEPQTIQTPDGQTFYLVGEVAPEESAGNPKVELPPPQPQPTPEATPSPVYYKYPSTTPESAPAPDLPKPQKVVYYRQEENVLPHQQQATPTTTESSGALYINRRSTTPKVSTSTEVQTKADSVTEELPVAESKQSEGFSFGFPAGMEFGIPQEFRTFLNTPPKWINMENW